ncbi:MAG: hypothetical protein Q9205_000377 [Flavoplaca limonia]
MCPRHIHQVDFGKLKYWRAEVRLRPALFLLQEHILEHNRKDLGVLGIRKAHRIPLLRCKPFPQYTSQMVYNVPQQSQPRSPYDTMPQYQPRHSAELEVLSSQIGVPQYYNPNDSAGAPAHASTPQQYAPPQFHQPIPYPAPGTGRTTIQSPYPVDMSEYPQSTSPEVAGQHDQGTSDVVAGFNDYREMLGQTFENTRHGRLAEAADSLLNMSERLLGHAQELGMVLSGCHLRLQTDFTLGLTSDNEALRDEHVDIWREFNTCWLALLQRQKDFSQQILDTGHRPVRPQSVLKKDDLERMAESLLQHCDRLEPYGLVDYQMGVWEEEIISIVGQCLEVLEAKEPSEGESVDPRIQQA